AKLEAVAVRLRIEMENELVAAADQRVEVDQRAAGSNVSAAAQTAAACLPAGLRRDVEPVNAELADVNVKLGKDRPFLLGWLELGESDQSEPFGGQAVDVQRVVEPGPRRPVELDLRRGQEDPALVRHGDVAELGLTEDRAIDPADMKA